MTLIRKVLLLVCGLMLVFSLASCEKKGPAEKAGEKIDKAVEKAGENVGSNSFLPSPTSWTVPVYRRAFALSIKANKPTNLSKSNITLTFWK